MKNRLDELRELIQGNIVFPEDGDYLIAKYKKCLNGTLTIEEKSYLEYFLNKQILHRDLIYPEPDYLKLKDIFAFCLDGPRIEPGIGPRIEPGIPTIKRKLLVEQSDTNFGHGDLIWEDSSGIEWNWKVSKPSTKVYLHGGDQNEYKHEFMEKLLKTGKVNPIKDQKKYFNCRFYGFRQNYPA